MERLRQSWPPLGHTRPPLWRPTAMECPPPLACAAEVGPSEARYALLVSPFYPKDPHASFGKHVLTPALSLTTVAAATPGTWRVRIWDENLLQGPPPADPLPQVVGITVHLTFASRAYALAAWYRRQGCRVVLGGLHVTACPEEAAAHADAVAVGDGVAVWPQILRDVEAGRLQPRYEAGFTGAFDRDPPPRTDLAAPGSFLTPASLIATRGCRNRCDFCYLSTRGLRMPYRTRPVAGICDEVIRSRQPYVVFLDNNLGSDRNYLRELCAALEPLGVIWSAAVTLDVTDDPALVREMARSGCTGVFVGFESLTDANLLAAGKRTPRCADYARRVRIFQEHGIQVNGSFVFGFDEDRRDVFPRTMEWIEGSRLECATFHILTPYPGTPLFRRLESEGRLLHRDWSLYDTAHAVFRPRHMSPEELELGYDWIYRQLFKIGSIWRRRPRQLGAVPGYVAMAFLYKRANRLWPLLIRHRLVNAVWRPLVALARQRHLRVRRRWQQPEVQALQEPETGGTSNSEPRTSNIGCRRSAAAGLSRGLVPARAVCEPRQ